MVFHMDFGELGGDGVELGHNGHDVRDGSTSDRDDGPLPIRDGLDCIRGEVLDQVGV